MFEESKSFQRLITKNWNCNIEEECSIARACLTAEIFPCLFPSILKSSWIISVELAIGPEEGISYLTDKGANVSPFLFSLCRYCLNKHDPL